MAAKSEYLVVKDSADAVGGEITQAGPHDRKLILMTAAAIAAAEFAHLLQLGIRETVAPGV